MQPDHEAKYHLIILLTFILNILLLIQQQEYNNK
jgi:hypothetical protein